MAVGDLAQNVQETSRFNPYLPDRQPDNYLGYSRGAKSRETPVTEYVQRENEVFAGNLRRKDNVPNQVETYVHPIITDRSKGILYEGLGQAASSAITLGDQLYKAHIRSEVQGQIDSVRGEFGVDAAADVYGKDTGPVPSELEKQAQYLTDLTEAYQTGVLKESHYWAKLDVVARSMRSRFPLYGEYVDQVVSNVTGNVPANALRRALANEAQDAQENSPARQMQKLEDWAIKNVEMPADYFTRKERGDPYSVNELEKHIAEVKTKENELSRRKSEIELQNATEKTNQDFVKNTARMEVWDKFTKTMTGMNSTWGSNYKSMMELANGAYADQNVTPDEANQIRQAWQPLRQMMLDGFRETMLQEMKPGSGLNYMKLLDKASLDDLQGSVDLFLKSMEDGLVNQHFGILGSNQAFLEAIKSSDQLTLLQHAPFLRTQQALKESVGPEMANSILTYDAKGLEATAKALSDISTMDITTAPNGSKPLAPEFDKQWDSGNKDPAYYRSVLDRAVINIANPELAPQARANTANNLFVEDFTYRFSKEDQQKYYMQFTSPGFVKQMVDLKDKGQTSAFENYSEWVLGKFNVLNRTAMHDAKAVVSTRPNMRLEWDDKTYQLKVAEGTGDVGTYGSGLSMAMEKVFLEPAARSAITQINTALRGLVPLFQSEKGADVNQLIMETLRMSGIDINKPDMGNKSNAIMNFYDLVGDAFSRYQQSFEEGASGSE